MKATYLFMYTIWPLFMPRSLIDLTASLVQRVNPTVFTFNICSHSSVLKSAKNMDID
jgi:hypothetical protein